MTKWSDKRKGERNKGHTTSTTVEGIRYQIPQSTEEKKDLQKRTSYSSSSTDSRESRGDLGRRTGVHPILFSPICP